MALAALGASSLVASIPGAALADNSQAKLGGYQLDEFDPSAPGDDFFGVPSAWTPGNLVPRFGATFEYAHNPLLLEANKDIKGGEVVTSQAFLHLSASLTLADRVMITLNLPIAVLQNGDSPKDGTLVIPSPSGAELGDLKLGGRFRIWGADRSPFQIGVGFNSYFPTAGHHTYAGDGDLRLKPDVLVSGRAGGSLVSFVYAAHGAAMFHVSDNPHQIVYGAGAALSFANDIFQIGPEFYGSTSITNPPPLTTDGRTVVSDSSTGLELLGDAKVRVLNGLVFGFGAGPGFSHALGAPSYRVLGTIGWAPLPDKKVLLVESDLDKDGIPDTYDACPELPGIPSDDPKLNGCPSPDRDGDGIPDALDACPSVKGRANDDPTKNGCPADYDGDGIPDDEDACPNQKGVASGDPKRNGCPGEVDTDGDGIPDRIDACPNQKGSRNDDPAKNGCPTGDADGDGIPDAVDACPNERGLPNKDPAKNGCPEQVRVTTAEIVILKQVQFKFGKSSLDQTIDPVSDDLLTQVRDVILQHPEIKQIEVQGHTDDVGTADYNQSLSDQRAVAVRNWLVRKGIDSQRLSAKGYGSTRPLAPNTDELSRQKNRRVQLVIVQSNDMLKK